MPLGHYVLATVQYIVTFLQWMKLSFDESYCISLRSNLSHNASDIPNKTTQHPTVIRNHQNLNTAV